MQLFAIMLFKKLLKISLYASMLFFFTSCSTSKQVEPLSVFDGQAIKLTPTIINTDKPILLGGRIAMLTDSVLSVITSREDTLLTIINIPDGKILKRMFPK